MHDGMDADGNKMCISLDQIKSGESGCKLDKRKGELGRRSTESKNLRRREEQFPGA